MSAPSIITFLPTLKIFSLTSVKVLSSLAIFGLTLAGGMASRRSATHDHREHGSGIAEALSFGIFFGLGVFHMLPEAKDAFYELYPFAPVPLAYLICLSVIACLMLIEYVLEKDQSFAQNRPLLGWTLLGMLSFHAFFEGTALGINHTILNTLIILSAILLHKSGEGFALIVNLRQWQFNEKMLIKILWIFSFITPLGVAVGTLSRLQASSLSTLNYAILNAFSAGVFCYLSLLHYRQHGIMRWLICPSHKIDFNARFYLTLFCEIFGIAIMALTAYWGG